MRGEGEEEEEKEERVSDFCSQVIILGNTWCLVKSSFFLLIQAMLCFRFHIHLTNPAAMVPGRNYLLAIVIDINGKLVGCADDADI